MNTQLTLEEKLDLAKDGLNENLQKKQALGHRISQQFEALKRLEISLEKRSRATTTEE
jgi:hypothetical protein